jgi:A/G-specific adenine glycosylase
MSASPQTRIHDKNIPKLVIALLNWFVQNARDLPWRRTRDPYAIWVSEIMLQQTQVKTVIPFWNRWMQELPTIEAAAQASSAKIHKLWEGLGYYTRVRNLQKAAQVVVEKHGGKFPEKFGDVLALPGIGRYTAGAISSIAFNQPAPILDGNVIRVLARVFAIAENPREKAANARLWRLAEELVINSKLKNKNSKTACSHLNQSLMELGALVCTPRNPQCGICPVKKRCVAFQENRVQELPNPGRRETATARRFVAFVAVRNGRFLVRQRPAGTVNAHLWEFPNVEMAAGILPAAKPRVPPGGKHAGGFKPAKVSPGNPGGKMPPSAAGGTPAATLASAARHSGFVLNGSRPLCTVKHSITRYRITLEAFAASTGGIFPAGGVWKTPAQMERLAFTAAHKKLASAAAKSILSGR